MKQYHDIVKEILSKGVRKRNRTGVDTISKFNINYEIDLAEGFPLLTTKKISWKNIVVENLWFISGKKDIGFLKKHGCKFWDAWTDEVGLVPSAYGSFWRDFPVEKDSTIDQLRWVVDEIKRNPDSRRLVISAWHPGNALYSKLPPCHLMFIFNVQYDAGTGEPRLNLHLTQRSADVALGVPYNIAGYAFILSLVSRIVGIKPGKFAHTMVDAHIYTSKEDGSMSEYDHVPGLVEQISREGRKLPRMIITTNFKSIDDLDYLYECSTHELLDIFKLVDYDPHPEIKFKVAV